MMGHAIYQDQYVYIIEYFNGEYLINWGGPVWVHASKLTQIELITKGA